MRMRNEVMVLLSLRHDEAQNNASGGIPLIHSSGFRVSSRYYKKPKRRNFGSEKPYSASPEINLAGGLF